MLIEPDINELVENGIAAIDLRGQLVPHPVLLKEFGKPIIALDVMSDLPTPDEVVMLRQATMFLIRQELGPESPLLSSADIPHDYDFNTLILLKGPWWAVNENEGWAFRRRLWPELPKFEPHFGSQLPCPRTLTETLMVALPGFLESVLQPLSTPTHAVVERREANQPLLVRAG